MRLRAAFVPAMLAAQGAWAQAPAPAGWRTLEVPRTAAWKHAHTGMVLPAAPLGMTRTKLHDSTGDELDVMAEYKDHAAGMTATVYIYKTQLPDASLWFDRSFDTIRLLPAWKVDPAAPAVVATFTPPGATVASGLIGAFDVDGLGHRGSALAVAPLGGWLVKVRLSAVRLDGAATGERLRAFVGALRWPEASGGARPAKRIAACKAPLAFKRAKLVKPDLAQSMLGGLLGSISTGRAPAEFNYCREPGASVRYGVYRSEGSTSSYILAINDAGIALSLQPSLSLTETKRKPSSWSMNLLDRTVVAVLPMFNRLPPPEQAYQVATASPPTMTIGTEPGSD